uniref:Uncharacterized protein n=1 Tax=viral metagenome TaxID=1070528 RepID=A0A6C0LIN6_9ZZZZ
MKSVTKGLRKGRKGRKTIKRGGAKETKEYPGVGTYVGSIDANGKRQSTGRFDAGKMTYENGDVFEGFWNKDKATGLGLMTYANGDDYRGGWSDGKRQGEGKIQYSDGRIYNGLWIQDEKRGQGTMAYPDGSKYIGQWMDDKRNGPGAIQYKNKDEYHGEWVDDKRKDGPGAMIYSNDDQYQIEYQGNFVDDKRNGTGVIVYKNGDQYEGEWGDDKRQGEGTMYYKDGRRYKGDWFEDKIQGEGAMMYPDGSVYIGSWVDGKRQGQGVLKDANRNDVYRGNWVNDQPNGANIDPNQIHKFTANINFDELNAFLQLHSKKENPYINQPSSDNFGAYIEDSMGKIIQSADVAKAEERINNFDFLMENTLDNIKYSVYSDSLKTGVFLSLKYTQLQPEAFKEAYVQSYLDDTCKAHGDDISLENLSCPTGTFERFVTSLGPAATTALSAGQATEEQKQEYEKLAEMITRNLETLIPNLIREWQRSHKNGVGLENIVGDEARRANLKAYIEETVTNDTPEINALIDKLIGEHADSVGYDNDELQLGGRKTRKRRRKGSTKKTRKRKLRKRKGTK